MSGSRIVAQLFRYEREHVIRVEESYGGANTTLIMMFNVIFSGIYATVVFFLVTFSMIKFTKIVIPTTYF